MDKLNEQPADSNPLEHVVSVADWSKAHSTDTHALIRGEDAKTSPLWGDVIFVEHDVHYWLKGVGAVQISDEAWVVLESRPKAH